MKNWIIVIFFILIILLAGTGVYAYQTIREPLLHEFEQAERYVNDKGLLETISATSYFHGTEAYYVFTGITDDRQEAIVWVSENFHFHHTELASNGISKEDAIAIVNREDDIKRIQSVKLGYERGLPIYEVTYLNEDNRKGYYYLTFNDGTFMKRYVLRTD